ncbi:hypothetical protein DV738_g53, partial [Chaetothyriales sp. CBS 135597]
MRWLSAINGLTSVNGGSTNTLRCRASRIGWQWRKQQKQQKNRVLSRDQVRNMTRASTTTASAATNGRASAWHTPGNGPSQYDFRSDTMTTPTVAMLEAIQQTSLQDDVTQEDSVTNSLEAHVAALTGKEAALLVMSGTMGNQVALRTHLTTPPYSIVCDLRSHIIAYEGGGGSLFSGAMTLTISPRNKHHVTLAEIEEHTTVSDDVHACPTTVISLENTLNGTIMPQTEIEAISRFARANGIAMHLDGARIWEAAVATKTPLTTLLAPFDSASLCFSKGLGAPIGSIVVGTRAFIARARRFRKIFGGGTRQAGVISAPARVAVDETFGLDPAGQTGKLAASHAQARTVAELWQSKGGKLTYPVETNMVWLDIASLGVGDQEFVEILANHGIRAYGSRLVVHYQISQDGVARLAKAMDEVLALSAKQGAASQKGRGSSNGVKKGIYAANQALLG